MGFYNFNEEGALAADSAQSGSKVLDTGVYKVTVVTASKVIASTGATGIDWSIHVEGSKYPNMVYGMWVFKSNGDRIFNMDIVDSLMGIVGVKTLTEFDKMIDVKGGTKQVTALKELDGVKCQVAIQKEFDAYNGKVTEKNIIKAFFTPDGKTYAESVGNKPAKQIEYYRNKLKDNETTAYKQFKAEGNTQVNEVDTSYEEANGGSIL